MAEAERYERLFEGFKRAGQEHVFGGWGDLDGPRRKAFLDRLEGVDPGL